MCGISGVVAKKKIDGFLVKRMNALIRHRGPDDEGFFILNGKVKTALGSPDTASSVWESNRLYAPKKIIEENLHQCKLALGHRRLSILDLSANGHQPMCTSDGDLWISYNGEIYNHQEIKKELIILGAVFQSDTDTEVILEAYRKWGINCQDRFKGMWAFAIIDIKNRVIFLSRDRFGIKPLYYWLSPGGDFYFASEIKQFSVLPGWYPKLNVVRSIEFLYNGLMDHTCETLFDGVYSVPPGHCILETWSEGPEPVKNRNKVKKWYQPTIKKYSGSYQDAVEEFRDKLFLSVSQHLRADVPIGSALSGGLDSSSIVAIVDKLFKQSGTNNPQNTFSSCSEDIRFDERMWMEKVVKTTNVKAYYIYPSPSELFNEIEKLVWYLDEPFHSLAPFLSYNVFKKARQKNISVMLNGQGADEYLSGYGELRRIRQTALLKNFEIKGLCNEFSSLKELGGILYRTCNKVTPLRIAKYAKYIKLYGRGSAELISSNCKTLFYHQIASQVSREDRDSAAETEYQLLVDPLQKYLKQEDRNSMAHSIEARVPFLDHELVEFARSLPIDYLDCQQSLNKRILVDAMLGTLTDDVRMRKDKKGFITPEELWFTQTNHEDFMQLFDKYSIFGSGVVNIKSASYYMTKVGKGEIRFDHTYWRLIVFSIWMKIFSLKI
jgi:asparagine synthase (glutamine-hydrolysing)